MAHEPERDQLLIRYLLGELAPSERDELEDRYFIDGDFHDELVAIEDELIDSYVRGELEPLQRASFERFFLLSPERNSKVDFARAFTQYVDASASPQDRVNARVSDVHRVVAFPAPNERASEPRYGALAAFAAGGERAKERGFGTSPQSYSQSTLWESAKAKIAIWVKIPGLQVAFAALLLILCSIPLVIHRERRPEPALKATNLQPAPDTAVARISPAQPDVENEKRTPFKARKVIPLLAFSLFSVERGSGGGNELKIPPGDYTVRLRLHVEGEPYPAYQATLETPEARIIAKRRVQGRAPADFYVDFSSKLLVNGDYILRLNGLRNDGPPEQAGGFAFQVVR